MTILEKQLTKEQIVFYGEIAKSTPYSATPWLDMVKKGRVLSPTKSNKISFDMKVGKIKMAALKKKGGNGVKLLGNGWVRVTIDAGVIEASINLSARELQEMQSGETEVLLDGVPVKTSAALVQDKMSMVKESIVQRMNLMSAQLVNSGTVTFSDGLNKYDFGIPATVTKDWDTDSITKIFHDILRDYRKANGSLPVTLRILVGHTLAEKLLTDDEFQGARDAYNQNIANFSANTDAMIVGSMLNRVFEEAEIAVDERGEDLMGAMDIKLVDTAKLGIAYAGIEIVNASGTPDILAADYFADIEVASKKQATAELFGKSGFLPIITDPESLRTYTITKS